MARPKKATAQDTRTLAIDAADALLHQHGYLGVSMDAIAEAVGIRKASLYHHFPAGKDELILEIANRSTSEGTLCFTQALESNGGIRSQLTELARAIIGKRQQNYAVLRDAMRFMASEHQTHIYQEFYNGQFRNLHTALEQAVARGELQKHDTERCLTDLNTTFNKHAKQPRGKPQNRIEIGSSLFVCLVSLFVRC
jgi:AcrR family transcriptional regulator